jgi:hypothetical protein
MKFTIFIKLPFDAFAFLPIKKFPNEVFVEQGSTNKLALPIDKMLYIY